MPYLLLLSLPAFAENDELRSSVTRMAKISSSWSPAFSPDGSEIAFVSNLSGVSQVWRMPTSGGFPVQITDLDETVGGVSWSPDGQWLAVSAAPGGGMNAQVYLVSPDGFTVTRLTPGGQEGNWLGPWNKDGSLLGFSSNRDSPSTMNPWVHDLSRNASRKILDVKGVSNIGAFRLDTEEILLNRLAGRGDNNLHLVSLDGKTDMLLTPHEPPGLFLGVFGADGRYVYIGHNDQRDRFAFGRIDLRGGSPSEIETLAARDDGGLEGLDISPSGDMAALVWNIAGRSELEIFTLSNHKRRTIDVPADLIVGVRFSHDGKLLSMVGRGADKPNDIYVLDVRHGEVMQLTKSPHAGVDLAKLVRPELIKFASHDGLEISGWLYEPTDISGPAPYVLSFHGGPEGQERPSFRSTYQALLAQGIGVFAPNIRGSSGFGKRFVNLDNRELRFNANKDIEACANYLVDSGIADRNKLGIIGGSYGGYAVMVAVTEFPDLFAAGVNLFGMVNFATFFANTEPWMAAISGTEYGNPDTQADLLKQLSPIYKLDQVKTPLLVQHGANDTNVPVIEAEQVVSSLQERDVPVEYVLFEDEGHGFRKEKNRITSDVESVNWFVRYLKGNK